MPNRLSRPDAPEWIQRSVHEILSKRKRIPSEKAVLAMVRQSFKWNNSSQFMEVFTSPFSLAAILRRQAHSLALQSNFQPQLDLGFPKPRLMSFAWVIAMERDRDRMNIRTSVVSREIWHKEQFSIPHWESRRQARSKDTAAYLFFP